MKIAKKEDLLLYFDLALESTAVVLKYIKGKTVDDYFSDNLLQDAVNMRLQVIGESLSKVPEEFRSLYKQVPWKKVIGLRQIISHDYSEIDYELVWSILTNDLKLLKNTLKQLEKDIEGEAK